MTREEIQNYFENHDIVIDDETTDLIIHLLRTDRKAIFKDLEARTQKQIKWRGGMGNRIDAYWFLEMFEQAKKKWCE